MIPQTFDDVDLAGIVDAEPVGLVFAFAFGGVPFVLACSLRKALTSPEIQIMVATPRGSCRIGFRSSSMWELSDIKGGFSADSVRRACSGIE